MSKKKRSRKRKRRQGPLPNLNSKNVRENAKVTEFPIKDLTTENLSSSTLIGVNNFVENCDKTASSDCDVSMVSDFVTTPLRIEKRNDLRNRKTRSNSSMAKLHSPGVEKVPLKSNSATQTITETPRVNRNCLLDMEYEIDLLDKSLYKTPLRHVLSSHLTPIFDLKDLNNLRNNYEEKVTNCSRNLNQSSLKRLKNFNEVILNTSQDIDQDNCELYDPVEKINIRGLDYKETNQMEISFFTPQLYNGELASTPIHKSFLANPLEKNCVFENENDLCHVNSNFVSISTQVEQVTFTDVGLQTSCVNLKSEVTPKVRVKCASISRRRSYKSMTPTISFYKMFPKHDITIRVSPSRNVIVNRSKAEVNDMCSGIFSIIRKLHMRYSSRVPEKLLNFCSWLGCTIKKSLSSFYQVYTTDKCENKDAIEPYNSKNQLYQISILKSGIDDLKSELNRMEIDSRGSFVKFNTIDAELDQLKKELTAVKQQLHGIKEINSRVASAPPPPPPPIPPPPPPFPPANNYIVSHTKTPKTSTTKKKINENSRPIISLDDILKVKLKKIADRPTPIHRVSEPQMSTLLQNVKLRSARSKGQTPSSSTASSVSSSSNSPCSSLTRILSNVNTNVCRVKRLHHVRNNYSFDDFSRKSLYKRDREN